MRKEIVILALLIMTALLGFLLVGNGISGMVVADTTLEDVCAEVDCSSPALTGFVTAVESNENQLNSTYVFQTIIGIIVLIVSGLATYNYVTHHDIFVRMKREYY